MAGLAIDSPVTLTEALRSLRVLPGDVLELADGVYQGAYIANLSIIGTEAAPVIIRPRNPGMVTIDGSLTINGPYVHVYDIDFTDSAEDRTVETPGVTCNQVGAKFVGCRFTGLRSSGLNWFGDGAGSVVECVFDASEGHAIYSHNNGGGLREIARCLFNPTPHYGLHVYSAGSNKLRDYQITNNVFYSASIAGGGLGLANLVFNDNIQLASWLYLGKYKIDGGVDENCTANRNVVIDGAGVTISDPEAFTCADNVCYQGVLPYTPPDGWTVTEKPATLSYTIPFTETTRWTGIQVDYTTATGEFAVSVVDVA